MQALDLPERESQHRARINIPDTTENTSSSSQCVSLLYLYSLQRWSHTPWSAPAARIENVRSIGRGGVPADLAKTDKPGIPVIMMRTEDVVRQPIVIAAASKLEHALPDVSITSE